MPRPFVLIGDAPCQPTGLSRILTDLATRLWAEREALDIDLLTIGQIDLTPLPHTGVPLRIEGAPWKTWVYSSRTQSRDQAVWEGCRHAFGELDGRVRAVREDGILFAIQDPSRSYGLLGKGVPPQWQRWGYFLVDGTNARGTLGGPAAESVRQFDRVLAYGPYGESVLAPIREARVEWLPHGIDTTIWKPDHDAAISARASSLLRGSTGTTDRVIGCIATNTERKDLPLFMEILRALRQEGRAVRGWLHTDQEIGAWSVPQIAEDAGLDWRGLTVTTPTLPDPVLAAMVAQCAVTVGVGRGEGFGYPLLESLACGVPIVAAKYAGATDLLLPSTGIRAPFFQPQGLYGIHRPLLDPDAFVDDVRAILDDPSTTEPGLGILKAREYDWQLIWPAWRRWILDGLNT